VDLFLASKTFCAFSVAISFYDLVKLENMKTNEGAFALAKARLKSAKRNK